MTNPLLSIETLPAPLAPEKPVVRCSDLPALRLCPGKLAACDGLQSKSTPQSEVGDRIHKWMATGGPKSSVVLEPAERELAEYLYAERRRTVEDLIGTPTAEYYEHRMEVDFGLFILRGHADYIAIGEDKMLVDDTKTGFTMVDQAVENAQGMGYVECAWRTFGVESIYMKFGTRFDMERNPPALYEFPDLIATHKEILHIVSAALAIDAKRTVSQKACRYCSAFGTKRCPESKDVLLWWGAMDLQVAGRKKDAKKLHMQFALAQATPEQRARAMEWFKVASPTMEVFYEGAKALLADTPDAIPGWELQGTGDLRVVADPKTARERLVAAEILTEEESWGVVKIAVAQAEEKYYRKQQDAGVKGFTKKDAVAKVAEVLAGLVKPDPKDKSIRRVKGGVVTGGDAK